MFIIKYVELPSSASDTVLCTVRVCKNNSATESTGLIVIVKIYSFALIWGKQYFLFDPHSTDANGIIIPDGTSALVKFKSLKLKNIFKKCMLQILV